MKKLVLLSTLLFFYFNVFASTTNALNINKELTALFSSLEKKLENVKGTKVSAAKANKKNASVFETTLELDYNSAYIVIENNGIRYHQTMLEGESDKLSLVEELENYQGDYSVLVINNDEKNLVYKIKSGRKNIGFLQFKPNGRGWHLLSFVALAENSFKSNLELILNSGVGDFAGLKGTLKKDSGEGIVRYHCNLKVLGANETEFVDIQDGKIYQILGIYQTLPFSALKAQVEKINSFSNNFQIVDRGEEGNTYKIYLNANQTDYIIEVRNSNGNGLLSVLKDRQNSTATPIADTPVSNNNNNNNNNNTPASTPSKPNKPINTPISDISEETSEPQMDTPTRIEETKEMGIYQFPGPDSKMGCYVGEVDNGKRHGKGIFTIANGTQWEGEWENDQLVGTVKMRDHKGGEYEGIIKNYQKNGFGKYTWKTTGNRYEGTWKNDKRAGKGKFFDTKRNRKFEGMFVNSRMQGKGTWYYDDGSSLSGKFEQGKKVGTFTISTPDGQTQQCEFIGGKVNSKEPIRLVEKYGSIEVAYIKGLKHGPAIVVYNDGTIEERTYQYDKLNGPVVCTYPDGEIQELEYARNKLLSKGELKMRFPSGVYEGKFKDGLRNGGGSLFYDNGMVEDGSYVEDKKNGVFTIVGVDGEIQMLNYKSGVLQTSGKVRIPNELGYFQGILEKGKKQGKGKFVFLNGNILEGSWENDLKSGGFRQTFADGTVALMLFEKDRLLSSSMARKKNEGCELGLVEIKPTSDVEIVEEETPVSPPQKEVVEEVDAGPSAVDQFIENFKKIGKQRGYKLVQQLKDKKVNEDSAMILPTSFRKGKEYLFVAVFEDCEKCEILLGRGDPDDYDLKKPQVKHEETFTYAVYSFVTSKSNSNAIWAFPEDVTKNGKVLLFERNRK